MLSSNLLDLCWIHESWGLSDWGIPSRNMKPPTHNKIRHLCDGQSVHRMMCLQMPHTTSNHLLIVFLTKRPPGYLPALILSGVMSLRSQISNPPSSSSLSFAYGADPCSPELPFSHSNTCLTRVNVSGILSTVWRSQSLCGNQRHWLATCTYPWVCVWIVTTGWAWFRDNWVYPCFLVCKLFSSWMMHASQHGISVLTHFTDLESSGMYLSLSPAWMLLIFSCNLSCTCALSISLQLWPSSWTNSGMSCQHLLKYEQSVCIDRKGLVLRSESFQWQC